MNFHNSESTLGKKCGKLFTFKQYPLKAITFHLIKHNQYIYYLQKSILEYKFPFASIQYEIYPYYALYQ